FILWSKEDKYRWTQLCHAEWPCKGKCMQDWTYKCPFGWRRVIKLPIFKAKPKLRVLVPVVCKPPPSYDGPCGSMRQDLTNFDFAAKRAFAFRCQLRWPCRGSAGGSLFASRGINVRINPLFQRSTLKDDAAARKKTERAFSLTT
ncbi:unnamed protein product, partial [Vitrella brassicaformis CCMP3155]